MKKFTANNYFHNIALSTELKNIFKKSHKLFIAKKRNGKNI
jgi:hypothetical protein